MLLTLCLKVVLMWVPSPVAALTKQVYEELQGHTNDMFYPSSGMLLVKNMHHAYDALKWSLYQKVSK